MKEVFITPASSLAKANHKDMNFDEAAKGCVFGAFTADSCGSYLEFEVDGISQQEITKCMTMPGGGVH